MPEPTSLPSTRLTHLQRLEAQGIHHLREVVAEAERSARGIDQDSRASMASKMRDGHL